MAVIDGNAILRQIKRFEESATGQNVVRKAAKKMAHNGKYISNGSLVITEDQMIEAANKMISVLIKTAKECDLPLSVQDLVKTSDWSNPVQYGGNKMIMYINFEGDTHRDSVVPDKYDGVDNIIVLLNNGYKDAKGSVYGLWKRRGDYGPTYSAKGDLTDGVYIRTRLNRPGIHFIEQAIDDFNGNYGEEYSVTAIAGDAYK